MSEELATSPVAEAATAAPEAPEVALDAPETDLPEGHQPEQVDDSEDVDYEGKKYRVPKEIKDALLRQSDYTRKTQEVAESRRALEAQQAQFQQATQAHQEHIRDVGKLVALDEQLQEWGKVNWQQLSDQDPARAQAAWIQYSQLKDQRSSLAQQLAQKEQQRAFEAQQRTAKHLEEAQATLKRDIPEWSPELANKLRDFAVTKGGLKAEEVASLTDPRAVKILHLAYVGQQLIEKQRAAARPQAPVANPVPTVSARSAPAAVNPLSDKAPTDDWMKARSAQVAKRGR
jgi:hypothetical protein